MTCPHCSREVPLSWKRYWTSPRGRHTCRHCGKRFRMTHSFRYYATVVGLWILFGVTPAGVALALGATDDQAFCVYLIVGALFVFPIDRHIDDTWRGTVALKNENA